MIVLDGDYMFNIVSGSVDYLSYWGDVPENLVVGINQKDTRFQDSSVFDNITHTPISSTASFYDFIVNELIPYFSKNYRVSSFKVIVGQERTGSYYQAGGIVSKGTAALGTEFRAGSFENEGNLTGGTPSNYLNFIS